MVPVSELGLIRYSLTDFYGMDHPDYLDVFVEFGEERDKLTDMIAATILAAKNSNQAELREMIFMRLGYMGFDSDEELLYTRVERLLTWIARHLSISLPLGKLIFVEAIEDADWVNVIYREYLEPVCETPLPTDSISCISSPDWNGL